MCLKATENNVKGGCYVEEKRNQKRSVHTVDASDRIAEALVMEGNRIVYVGSNEGTQGYIDPETESGKGGLK